MAHPKTITDALSGLLVLALDRPRAEHGRLIEQFLDQYPEIHIGPPITRDDLVELLLRWDSAGETDLRDFERKGAGELVDEFLAERGGA